MLCRMVNTLEAFKCDVRGGVKILEICWMTLNDQGKEGRGSYMTSDECLGLTTVPCRSGSLPEK